jgi:hypothetical protein
MSLNIIITSIICFCLLQMQALLHQVLNSEMSSMYTKITIMLVKSAMPFTIINIGVLITLVHNVPLSYVFGYVWNIFYIYLILSPPMHTCFHE